MITAIQQLAENIDRRFSPVPTCTITFRGFDAIVGGKRDTFDGVAKISAVNPEYRGPEGWVVMDVTAKGRKHQFALPESHDAALAFWMKRNPKISADIEARLKAARDFGGVRS